MTQKKQINNKSDSGVLAMIRKMANNKTLISDSKAIADIVGCDPAQIRAFVRYERYKFPTPCTVARYKSITVRFYRLDDIIDYKQVYQDLLENGIAKEYQGRNNAKSAEKMAELAVDFFGGNPSALAKFGRAFLSDGKGVAEIEQSYDSLPQAWQRKHNLIKGALK